MARGALKNDAANIRCRDFLLSADESIAAALHRALSDGLESAEGGSAKVIIDLQTCTAAAEHTRRQGIACRPTPRQMPRGGRRTPDKFRVRRPGVWCGLGDARADVALKFLPQRWGRSCCPRTGSSGKHSASLIIVFAFAARKVEKRLVLRETAGAALLPSLCALKHAEKRLRALLSAPSPKSRIPPS